MNLDQIEQLAGPAQRGKSFRIAAQEILRWQWKFIIETGCYRGIGGDGESTLILADLSKQTGCLLDSYDINPDHIAAAKAHVPQGVVFHEGDSVSLLSRRVEPVNFAYLDSYDYSESDPRPSQLHQLAEVGAILGKLTCPGMVMCDDCALPHGGKNGLSDPFLLGHGWRCIFSGYQKIYTNYQ